MKKAPHRKLTLSISDIPNEINVILHCNGHVNNKKRNKNQPQKQIFIFNAMSN